MNANAVTARGARAILMGVAAATPAFGQAADTPVRVGHVGVPVREVTIYKDGHAFVEHRGRVPTSGADVVLDQLPAPVIGTVWAYSPDPAAKLVGVVAGRRLVEVERTSLSIVELLLGNPGAEVSITEHDSRPPYAATIIGVPERGARELHATDPAGTDVRTLERAGVVHLKTAEGVRVLPLDRIRDVTFRAPPQMKFTNTERRNALTLRLDWQGKPAATEAEIGLVYLQRGIRWIPSYRVAIDGQGTASVRLQATLLNEMVDLDDVTAQLVIGAPSFLFKETLDPIALQDALAQLSQFFAQPGAPQTAGQIASNFDNALRTQTARMGEYSGGVPAGGGMADPRDLAGERNEDLFVFTLPHVTLRKGERLIVPVAECTLPYQDVFTLDLPFSPPAEIQPQIRSDQQADLQRLLEAPRVMHKLRLENKGQYPLTTAPALILRDGRVLGQGLMTYTSIGGNSDVEVTAAVDVQLTKEEKETGRNPNAEKWNDDWYSRIDLAGVIRLCNHRANPVDVEVRRYVLGHPGEASHAATVEQGNFFEEGGAKPRHAPPWWHWYGWPNWWHQHNGVGKFTWKLQLQPGQAVELTYAWHYYWR